MTLSMHPSAELYPWISVGAIAWGLLDCFFGYRVFKITLAVLGGLLGTIGGHAAGTALDFGTAGIIGSLILGGLVGAGLAYLLYIAAVFVAGFGFGATLGLLVLSHYHHMVALLSGAVLGLIGGFLAVKTQRILIILSTALLGSFRTMVALAYFTHQIPWLDFFQRPQFMPELLDHHAWLFPSILVLAVIGVIAQFELGGSDLKKKTKSKDE